MRKLFGLTASAFLVTAVALLAFGAQPATANMSAGCTDRPSGAPEGWTCTLDAGSGCNSIGWCQCTYTCYP